MGKYGRPESVNWPGTGDQDVHHFVKSTVDSTLQDAVTDMNVFLLSLESSTPAPVHVQSIQMSHYNFDEGEEVRHVVTAHIIIIGDVL